jgi:hypothetical protein
MQTGRQARDGRGNNQAGTHASMHARTATITGKQPGRQAGRQAGMGRTDSSGETTMTGRLAGGQVKKQNL